MSLKVAAMLLAAGKSRRMGTCKQLLPLGDTTVIGRCLQTLVVAGVDEIVVVVSPEGDAVATEAANYPVRIAVNTWYEGDMASSVRVGRNELSAEATGVIVALCDYPLVLPATVEQLRRAHLEHPGRIVTPCRDGRRGHPPLFPRQLLDGVSEDRNLREVVRCNHDQLQSLEVADPGILIDMDTPEDYQFIRRLME